MFGGSYRDDFSTDTITGDETYRTDISLDTDNDKPRGQLTYAEGSGGSHGVVCRDPKKPKSEVIYMAGERLSGVYRSCRAVWAFVRVLPAYRS